MKRAKHIFTTLGIGVALLVIFIIFLLLFSSILKEILYPDEETYWRMECIEDGNCKENIKILSDNKEIVITKETCLGNYWIWYEDARICKTSVNAPWDVNDCISRGYCWDYNRHRCEKINKEYCIKTVKECAEQKGSWQEEDNFCKLSYTTN